MTDKEKETIMTDKALEIIANKRPGFVAIYDAQDGIGLLSLYAIDPAKVRELALMLITQFEQSRDIPKEEV